MTPFDAAVEYHVRCERFDTTVCTGGQGMDGVLPANRRELSVISSHACRVLAECAELARMSVSEFRPIVNRHDVLDEVHRVFSATPFVPVLP